ncbi:Epididymal secretory protein E1 [Orchesella cincta]|uniref:Epididymal secretory protein E1 n=1 Tax=Orchesella cincta TaxID=48709 RepID=A0A1D2ND80_ORCCI|nr:Epididymal secretory protein E1 [Orchesella cincta]
MMTNNLFILIVFSTLSYLADAFSFRNASCSEATIHDLRIAHCNQEPCTIRKGEPLPFELDLSFTTPTKSSNVYFNVYIPKYAAPPAVHGSSLITATCDERNLGFDCPVSSNTIYTLKSHLIIDSQAVCTSNCENMGNNGTGIRDTKWRWAVSDRRKRGTGKKSYSSCSFRLALNIVE